MVEKSDVKITGFQIKTGQRGIYAISSTLLCSDNRLENNYVGLRADSNSSIKIANTDCKNNNYYGIQISTSSSVVIHDSEIMNNLRDGTVFWQGSSGIISDSVFSGNQRNGILVLSNSGIVIERSDIKSNTEKGIKIMSTSSVYLYGGNNITDNTGDGLQVILNSSLIAGTYSPYNEANGSDNISGNLGNGINVAYTSSSFVDNMATIKNNGGHGILCGENCSCSVRSSSIFGTGENANEKGNLHKASSDNCALLQSNFDITMPCIDVLGTRLPVELEKFTYPEDPSGYYWKLNLQ